MALHANGWTSPREIAVLRFAERAHTYCNTGQSIYTQEYLLADSTGYPKLVLFDLQPIVAISVVARQIDRHFLSSCPPCLRGELTPCHGFEILLPVRQLFVPVGGRLYEGAEHGPRGRFAIARALGMPLHAQHEVIGGGPFHRFFHAILRTPRD